MAQYSWTGFDASFAALSDVTRRGVLEQLGRADASITRLAWTNDEARDGGPVTTVTFEEQRGKTLVVIHELYPSKDALDAAGTGAADALGETFEQLDELLGTLPKR
jgi:hypothetical protein